MTFAIKEDLIYPFPSILVRSRKLKPACTGHQYKRHIRTWISFPRHSFLQLKHINKKKRLNKLNTGHGLKWINTWNQSHTLSFLLLYDSIRRINCSCALCNSDRLCQAIKQFSKEPALFWTKQCTEIYFNMKCYLELLIVSIVYCCGTMHNVLVELFRLVKSLPHMHLGKW